MQLSRSIVNHLGLAKVHWPQERAWELPEKVLQFGTGVLLRGLPDFFIDQANRQDLFGGRIVLVKSTASGDAAAFAAQDGLFTTCLRGVSEGSAYSENWVNASISRLLQADSQWPEVLRCAANPSLGLVISNTTEVGIRASGDKLSELPPPSFPGKLLAFLHERYRIFAGADKAGLVIVPTELIPNNGDRLLEILVELARQNDLSPSFSDWLLRCNPCCNSLVDRIVPGGLSAGRLQELEQALGYEDRLLIMAEPYALWAIESSDPRVQEIFSFHTAVPGLILAPDISKFRELKLRLLNGAHTGCCGLAVLAGYATVREAMQATGFYRFISDLMQQEIGPAITGSELSTAEVQDFSRRVLDRFLNPYMEHAWLAITLQYNSKFRTRLVPVLLRYHDRFGRLPARIALGLAAHLLFLRVSRHGDGQYYGEAGGKQYLVQDEQAAYFAEEWRHPEGLVERVLQQESLWGTDLGALPGLCKEVNAQLERLRLDGAEKTMKSMEMDSNAS